MSQFKFAFFGLTAIKWSGQSFSSWGQKMSIVICKYTIWVSKSLYVANGLDGFSDIERIGSSYSLLILLIYYS